MLVAALARHVPAAGRARAAGLERWMQAGVSSGMLMTATEPDFSYDPYDFEIDTDPYPI
jgi:hypothetical protein